MQILKMDLRNDTVRLRVDDLDDLWTLYNTVEVGDLVLARTLRREKLNIDDTRPERGNKKPVSLSVRVEKVEFHKYVNVLRLTGRIERGVDIGSYHTMNIEPGSTFSLVRKWKGSEIANLKEAVAESKRPLILVIALEEGEATIALIRQRGVDFIGEILRNIPGKREAGAREAARKGFFAEILVAVAEATQARGVNEVLVVGPELVRSGFKAYVEDQRETASGIRISYDTCYSPGRAGVYEALRRGSVDKVVSSGRVSRELEAVEQFLSGLASGRPTTYGIDDVERAASMGAVDSLLITDELFRERREQADAIIRKVESYSGDHLIVSTDHDGGTKLKSLGGVGAKLRYALPEA